MVKDPAHIADDGEAPQGPLVWLQGFIKVDGARRAERDDEEVSELTQD